MKTPSVLRPLLLLPDCLYTLYSNRVDVREEDVTIESHEKQEVGVALRRQIRTDARDGVARRCPRKASQRAVSYASDKEQTGSEKKDREKAPMASAIKMLLRGWVSPATAPLE